MGPLQLLDLVFQTVAEAFLLHLIHLEATYGHQMFPLGNGTKNVDKLMIRANILWER